NNLTPKLLLPELHICDTILLEEEIDRPAFLLLNEKNLKESSFKVGTVVKPADLIVKLNGEERASLPQDESPITGVVVEPLHKSISTERIPDTLPLLLENQQTPYVKSQTIAQSLHPNLKLKGSSIEKVEYPSDINENNTYLPETASGLLRYYKLWNCHYTKWSSLNEFSEHLSDVKKDCVHFSFKKGIAVLRKLFMCQTARIIKKVTRKQIANAIKLLTKEATIKKELEIVEGSVIVNGYHRINKHYDDFHEASTQLIKRKLSTNSDGKVDGLKKAR
ncbi:2178_t:CDS:2, partial [Funneliformis caledonium]